jgi:signal transduction histidine kinase/ligand-binding sensor domain-containing protein
MNMKFLTFSFLFLTVVALSQQPVKNFQNFNPRFEVFILPGGTLGNSVQGIVQDSAGFLWFGSQRGLHRYDGTNIFTYHYDPNNPNSLASDYIEYLFLDSKGMLWMSHWSDGGLTALDPATGKFTRYMQNLSDPEAVNAHTFSVLAEDRQGYMWIGGQEGLNRLDRKTGKFKHFHHDPKDPRSLSYNQVRALYVDKKGTLWVGTGFPWDAADPSRKQGGLNRYDPQTETFTRYLHDPKNPQSISHNVVRGMFEDSRGNFWVGTCGIGLQLMNREKGTFTRLPYDPKDPGKLSRPWLHGTAPNAQAAETHVTSILEDLEGRIWIAAAYGGLNVFEPDASSSNPAEGKLRRFEAKYGEGNLSTNFLWHLFKSSDGTVWIATGAGGGVVYKVKNKGYQFPFFVPAPSGLTFDVNEVSDAVKDKAGNVWVSYYDHPAFPLLRHDRKTGKTLQFHSGNVSSGGLSAQWVSSLLPDRDGFLWLNTENGLYRLDPQTGKFRHYSNPHYRPDIRVSFMMQDKKGYLWIYGWSSVLSRLDPKTGKFTAYKHDPGDPASIGGNNVRGLYEDARGNFWVSGGAQNSMDNPLFLDRFNPENTDSKGRTVFTHFIKEKQKGTAEYLTGDKRGNLWFLNGRGGIQKLNPATRKLQGFTSENSNLPNLSLTSLVKAKNGKFWLNDSEGFLCELDPETLQFSTYGNRHGVKTDTREISEVSVFVADDGEVLLGRRGGYLAFYPDSIFREENSRPPRLQITNFRLLDEQVMPGTQAFLPKPIWQTSELVLTHQQNRFAFAIACLDFDEPSDNQVQFMLENYDQGWRKDLLDGETPSYVNVPPGDYTFRVRGANSLGVWNQVGPRLKIKILPPWWKTWWAYTVYGLLILTGIYFFGREQRRRIIQKERQHALERELAQAKEIEKAYAELKTAQAQLIQSEKLASLGELTAGIAHEIQNPLNFVNNFAEVSAELAQEMKEEIVKGEIEEAKIIADDLIVNLNKINHHGNRASSIVKNMLEHSRVATGGKDAMHGVSTDINALADEYLRLAYHGWRAKESRDGMHGVFTMPKIETHFDPDLPLVSVVPQDIGRVLLNLINNAFYAVQQRATTVETLHATSLHATSVPHTQETLHATSLPYQPTVTISTKRLENAIEIRVQDNGSGIPEAIRDKIFQPFFTTKPTGQGTGLGLSLAYDIVTKGHLGSLKLGSNTEQGSVFIIQLPT